ncbi:Uncharacterised protein [Achromobacter insolitus]|nr:hypothetical protein LMG6003_04073 [Achromobacter insolitus]VEG66438.1 Uncharacterised protein [Achromobacter insolitus]
MSEERLNSLMKQVYVACKCGQAASKMFKCFLADGADDNRCEAVFSYLLVINGVGIVQFEEIVIDMAI